MTASPMSRTMTFLFTDIEGSTRLWEEQRDAMAIALAAHDSILRSAVEGSGGEVVKTTGDGMLASFERAEAAVNAALEGQRMLAGHAWPTAARLCVRMAIHTGTAETRDGDYFGPALNRAARLLAIGHGEQVLVSGATAVLVADDLPQASELIDHGEHLLRDLDRPEHVYQLTAPGLRRDFPPLRSAPAGSSNLPPQATSFVGRERELTEIAQLLGTAHLVTLVGVGGTGKTRLSLQVAASHADRHRDGVWLVELAPISDPALVEGAIARALGVQEQPGRPVIDTLLDFLRAKELLLIVDNCEHLIAAAAEVAEQLLASCLSLRLLATSREPLGVAGEAVYAVPSLALPELAARTGGGTPGGTRPEDGATPDPDALETIARSEAVRLFVERARSTLPSFDVDAENASSVVAICRRLDGIPLALELAAARVNVLSPAEIAAGLDDRFRLLTGGRRTAVPRQRTLQGLIDWSWDLLDDEDRRLMRRLSVFAGGWTLEAATAVTDDAAAGSADAGRAVAPESAAGTAIAPTVRLATLDGLGRLVDRSLVVVEHGAASRYRMLETIRQYAADQLAASGETVTMRDRHLAHFRQLALDAGPRLKGPEMIAALGRLDAEIGNLRAALDWSFDSHPARALEMSAALALYWHSRGVSEGADRMLRAADLARRWRSTSAEVPDAERAVLASAVFAASAWVQAVYTGQSGARALEEEALSVARESGDSSAVTDALLMVVFARLAGDGSLATQGPDGELAREAARLAEEKGDWYIAGMVQAGFAIHLALEDPAASQQWLQKAGESARRSGNPFVMANFAHVRGRIESVAGRPTEARRWLEEAAELFRGIGDDLFQLVVESEIAHALRRAGAIDEAEAAYRRTIRGWQRGGNRGAIAHQLESFAFLAQSRGAVDRATRLFGAADCLREVAGAPMTSLERGEYEVDLERLRNALDADAFREAWADGRRMAIDEAVDLALAG